VDDICFNVVRICGWRKTGLADDVNNLNCSEEDSHVVKQLQCMYSTIECLLTEFLLRPYKSKMQNI